LPLLTREKSKGRAFQRHRALMIIGLTKKIATIILNAPRPGRSSVTGRGLETGDRFACAVADLFSPSYNARVIASTLFNKALCANAELLPYDVPLPIVRVFDRWADWMDVEVFVIRRHSIREHPAYPAPILYSVERWDIANVVLASLSSVAYAWWIGSWLQGLTLGPLMYLFGWMAFRCSSRLMTANAMPALRRARTIMTFKIAEARHDLMNNTAVIVAHESSAGAGPQPTPS
jgi:hypothetical protein